MSLNDVNNDGDSSDSDNDNDDEVHSSDGELSFESDDEGNFQQNVNKPQSIEAESDSEQEDEEDVDDEELGDEEVDDEEGDDENSDDEENVYESDDSEVLSFEEEDNDTNENEEAPSTSSDAQKKLAPSKQNGTAKAISDKPKASKKIQVKKNEPNAVEAFKNEMNKSGGVSTQNGNDVDEYEKHDTDDEEDIRNTVGNIPMQWYDEYKHIGYDWDAKKIIKPAKQDRLDDFLKRMEDPNFWRTVKDPQTGQDVVLSEADIELIKRINSRRVPDSSFDDYTVCYFQLFTLIAIETCLIFNSLF